jgi:hypothetical protein
MTHSAVCGQLVRGRYPNRFPIRQRASVTKIYWHLPALTFQFYTAVDNRS